MLRDMAARTPEKRKADALLKLEAVESKVWVGSASRTSDVHLVPVTHTWNGSQVVLATGPRSRTVSNMTANPKARLALGETRDVVMIDVILIEAVPASDAPAARAEGYAAQAGWDARKIRPTTGTSCSDQSASKSRAKARTWRAAPSCEKGNGWCERTTDARSTGEHRGSQDAGYRQRRRM